MVAQLAERLTVNLFRFFSGYFKLRESAGRYEVSKASKVGFDSYLPRMKKRKVQLECGCIKEAPDNTKVKDVYCDEINHVGSHGMWVIKKDNPPLYQS